MLAVSFDTGNDLAVLFVPHHPYWGIAAHPSLRWLCGLRSSPAG